jgi:hypothetical protein
VVCSWSRCFRNAWSNSAILRSLFHTLSHSCTIGTSLCKKSAPAIPLPNILITRPCQSRAGLLDKFSKNAVWLSRISRRT